MEQKMDIFNKLKSDLTAYVELKLEFFKLSTYERTSKVLGVLSYGLIVLSIAFFAFLFIFLALGFFLDQVFGSPGAGFLVVSAIYLICLLIAILNKKKINNRIQNEIISALIAGEDRDGTTNNKQSDTDTSGEVKD